MVWWKLCLTLGLIVVGLSIVIFPAFPTTMANPDIGQTPVYAFEFASSRSDLIDIFGEPDDPLRAERIAKMDRGNTIDFAYMLAYSLFIGSFFFARFRESNQTTWLCLAAIALLAGLADFIENLILLEITSDLETAQGLDLLWLPVHLKFTCLYVAACGMGWYCLEQDKLWTKGFGVVQILVSFGALIHLFVSGGEEGTIAIVLAWIAQLAVAAMRVFKSSR